MSSLKKIIINPELFNTGNKTKKNINRSSNQQIHTIKPNLLKKHLINKIKEHKKISNNSSNNTILGESDKFTNELYDSFNYLSNLSERKKENAEKEIQRNIIANKTVKNHSTNNTNTNISYGGSSNNNNNYNINLELPDELKESYTSSLFEPTISNNLPTMKLHSENVCDKPYGCLKGGSKPTYRVWNNTTKKNTENILIQPKINIPQNVEICDNIFNDRENKLEFLKMKMKKQNQNDIDIINSNTNINSSVSPDSQIINTNTHTYTPIITNTNTNDSDELQNINNITNTNIINTNITEPYVDPYIKKKIKKTIVKKYTLGKSKNYNTVSILLKDNNTRKNVINAHKELKRVPINDIKNFLKIRGLLKVGGNAPNDVIRKTYESAMLTGEIVNKNKDILLHNFLHDTSL